MKNLVYVLLIPFVLLTLNSCEEDVPNPNPNLKHINSTNTSCPLTNKPLTWSCSSVSTGTWNRIERRTRKNPTRFYESNSNPSTSFGETMMR